MRRGSPAPRGREAGRSVRKSGSVRSAARQARRRASCRSAASARALYAVRADDELALVRVGDDAQPGDEPAAVGAAAGLAPECHEAERRAAETAALERVDEVDHRPPPTALDRAECPHAAMASEKRVTCTASLHRSGWVHLYAGLPDTRLTPEASVLESRRPRTAPRRPSMTPLPVPVRWGVPGRKDNDRIPSAKSPDPPERPSRSRSDPSIPRRSRVYGSSVPAAPGPVRAVVDAVEGCPRRAHVFFRIRVF